MEIELSNEIEPSHDELESEKQRFKPSPMAVSERKANKYLLNRIMDIQYDNRQLKRVLAANDKKIENLKLRKHDLRQQRDRAAKKLKHNFKFVVRY